MKIGRNIVGYVDPERDAQCLFPVDIVTGFGSSCKFVARNGDGKRIIFFQPLFDLIPIGDLRKVIV